MRLRYALVLALAAGCADPELQRAMDPGNDLPVGDQLAADEKADGTWGAALTCKHEFAITPSTIQPCKFWWTDPETGKKQPVFAGLPFLSWYGNFAIHGPIDNFRAANGGSLRRGYVSH